ncbi:CBS domain-containing protein [Pontibacillus halophilus]|nr:CBS domain-containing protein [Pontibacillus halophilus]
MKNKFQSVTASLQDPVGEALDTLLKHDFQAMPVLDGNEYVGMISQERIYEGYFHGIRPKEEYLSDVSLKDLVTRDELYVTEDDVFEKTLPLFKGFPILAVTNSERGFLGVVSRYDVIEQFESAFGAHRRGVRIAFTSEESEGRIARLSDILKHYHENVISLATFDETKKLARRIVLKLEPSPNIDKIAKRLEKAGFRVLDIKEDV